MFCPAVAGQTDVFFYILIQSDVARLVRAIKSSGRVMSGRKNISQHFLTDNGLGVSDMEMQINRKENDMQELDKQRIARAIKIILAILPNKNANLQTVLDLAMKDIPIYTDCHNRALLQLSRLIRLCPRCFGTFRKAEFWQILFNYLSQDEALEAYLQGFPLVLTEAQKQSIEDYLFELDFSPESINQGLARFGRRTSAKKFSHPRVGFVR